MSRTFPLALRPLGAAVHKPAAWFIPGAGAETWLAELGEWDVPLVDLRLYVVPTSVRDRRPVGALVTANGGPPPVVRRALRARPYGRLAGRLYVPVDAGLAPPVSDEELCATLTRPVSVLHPSAGLVGFGGEDALRVHDLLQPPPLRRADWDRAVPGPPPPPRLLSVEPDLPPMTVHVMLDEGRGDIGSEPPDDLPPGADERAVRHALSKAQRPGLKAISWLTNRPPGGAPGPAWMNALGNWANRKLGGINSALAAARHKELLRLQEMLKSDPDKGLRYAIPFGGGRSRGLAPPGGILTPRDVNFDLGRLGGGGAADAWHVPWEVRQQLMAQYREAANRELALGRYRRAAYVFAELLGDFASAAAALKQGRHYREAALLYREKLGNPGAAAECLEHGGLLVEAAALCEELEMYEKAAALYERLERPDHARRCYRQAVEAAKSRQQFVPAARLLETKLDAADEALSLLDSRWPESDGAGVCLREWFDLLGRLGRHEQASRRVAALRDDPRRPAVAAQLAGALAGHYPDPAVRALAADAARVIVGRRLPDAAAAAEARALADVVAKLAPHDRLLQRDARHYLSRRPAPRPAAPPGPRRAGNGPFLMHQFRLPEHVEWKEFSAAGEFFFGCGERGNELFLVRGRWDGMVQGLYWDREPGARRYVVEPLPDGRTLLVLPLGVAAQARAKPFPTTDAFPESAFAVTPSAVAGTTLVGAAVGDGGTLWTVADGGVGCVLRATRPDGSLASTKAVHEEVDPRLPVHVAARNGQAFLAGGNRLTRVGADGRLYRQTAPGPIKRMAAAAPLTRVRVALSMEEGGVLVWDDGDWKPFADGMAEPAVAFTRGGALVALSGGLGRAYQTDGKALRLVASFTSFSGGGAPVAVTPTNLLNHFAVFTSDGMVRVMQLTT